MIIVLRVLYTLYIHNIIIHEECMHILIILLMIAIAQSQLEKVIEQGFLSIAYGYRVL